MEVNDSPVHTGTPVHRDEGGKRTFLMLSTGMIFSHHFLTFFLLSGSTRHLSFLMNSSLAMK